MWMASRLRAALLGALMGLAGGCGGSVGENLAVREEGGDLSKWYDGPTLVEVLDKLEPPARLLDGPLRLPVTNVFKGQTAIASGVVQPVLSSR